MSLVLEFVSELFRTPWVQIGSKSFRDPTLRFRRAGQAGAECARRSPPAPPARPVGKGRWGFIFWVQIASWGYPHDAIWTQKMNPHRPFPTGRAGGAGGERRAHSAPAWPARRNLRVGSRNDLDPIWTQGVRNNSLTNSKTKLTYECDFAKSSESRKSWK